MKIFRKIGFSALVAGMALFAACSDDLTYTPGEKPAGEGIYFAENLKPVVEIAENATSVAIPVSRSNAEGAYTAALEIATEHGAIFNIPSSVTFAAGQKTANVVITFAFADIELDVKYGIDLTLIDPANKMPYGKSEYSFSIFYSPWVPLGKGMYTDDMMTTIYSIDPFAFEVEIQESGATPGLYRIKNPYHQNSPFFAEYTFEESVGASEDYYITIDASDPNAVSIPKQPMGVTVDVSGYGKISIASFKDIPGKLVNGIITFPTEGLAFVKESGKASYANVNGAFKLVLPGASEPATASVEYKGQFMSPAGENNAILAVDLLATAASCKYAVIYDNFLCNDQKIQEVADGIDDGTIPSVEVTKSGEVNYPMEVGGPYTVVVVPYDAKGFRGETAATTFVFIVGEPEAFQPGTYNIAISASKPYACPITFAATLDKNVFTVDGWFEFSGLNMVAVYDPATMTMTLDGSITDPEDKDGIFMVGLAYANKEKTQVYVLVSGDTGTDPCVINVNGEGCPSMLSTDLILGVVNMADGKYLGAAESIGLGTEFSAVTPPAPAMKQSAVRKMDRALTMHKLSSVSKRF